MASVVGTPFVSEEARLQLRNQFSDAINNKDLSDVCFKIDDDLFYGHQAILGFRSSVFKNIFSTYRAKGVCPVEGVENAEKATSKNEDGILCIDVNVLAGYSVSLTSFKIILTYLYNGELLINHENCLDIFSLARRLSLTSASNVCNEYLNELKGGSEVCGLISAALEKGEMELYQQCLEAVEQKTHQCMKSDMFLTLPMKVISNLMKNEKINCSEKQLFDAVIRWWGANKDEVAAGMNKKEQDTFLVENFLYFVRYPLMTPTEISDIERMNLLSASIIVDAYRFHASGKYGKEKIKGPINYNDPSFRTRARGESCGGGLVFDPQKCADLLVVSPDGQTLTFSKDGLLDYVACLTTTGYTSGVNFWEVHIEECDVKDHIMIGVSTSNQSTHKWIGQDAEGWSWFGNNKAYYHDAKTTLSKSSFGKGDVIGVKLDLSNSKNNGGLCFYKNGVPMGLGFSQLKNSTEKFFPSVSLRMSGSKVTIKSSDLKYESIYQTHLKESDQ